MTVIAKKELLYAGTFGPAAYLAGLVFIDRNSSKGKEEMNKAMERLKKDNIKLWIFPEGKLHFDNFGALRSLDMA
jgi:lysophosphatidate acyltransferase